MTRQAVLSLAAMLLTLGASAQTQKPGYHSVSLTTRYGEVSTVRLTDAMTTTFTHDDIIFADGTTTVSVPLNVLRTYTFVAVDPDNLEGIGAITLAEGQEAEVYTLDGRHVTTSRDLHFDTLGHGTYIVRTATATLKVTR